MFIWFTRFLNWLRSFFWSQELEITLVGLQSAGKTTFVNVLSTGIFKEDMIPTVGFNMRKVQKGRVTLKIWDIGGQPRFRVMWKNYCRAVQAIVYMVDSADLKKIDEAADALSGLFEADENDPTSNMKGTPLLVLGNKNDLPNALTTEQLKIRLRLDTITNRNVSIYSISCKNQTNLENTIQWLISKGKE